MRVNSYVSHWTMEHVTQVSELQHPLKSSEKGKRHKDNFTTETEIIITFPPPRIIGKFYAKDLLRIRNFHLISFTADLRGYHCLGQSSKTQLIGLAAILCDDFPNQAAKFSGFVI